MQKKVLKLGDVVRDMSSGFSGVATCRSEDLNGCIRWAVMSPIFGYRRMDSLTRARFEKHFDEEQLELVTPDDADRTDR